MCLPEWWYTPLRSCLCLVSLDLSPVICLPSCVSLSGGVRLSGFVCALSPFIYLRSYVFLRGGVRLSGLVCALSPFMSLPDWWCPPRRSCLCLVSLHVSPCVVVSASPVLSVPCLPSLSCVSLSGGVRLSGLVCALSPFMCLPEWWCPPLRSCLCLVSHHVSPCVAVSASPVLSVPCLPLCVSLSDGVRLSGLVCALSPFICRVVVSASPVLFVPCLPFVSLHVSP